MKELLKRKKVIVYEVVPERGVDQSKCLELCESMVDAGADVIAITDMPTSRVKVAPWAIGKLLVDKEIEVLLHFTRTSRNILRTESDLLGIYLLGVKNVLMLSGDSPEGGDYPDATVVNDISIYDLIKLAKMLSKGTDLAGKKIKGEMKLNVGAVFSPVSDIEIERAVRKVESGADFLISQPLYDVHLLEKAKEKLNVPILVSIAFFSSEKQLKRFASVPGIDIPEELIRAVEGKDKEYVAEYTFEYLLKSVEGLYKHADGFYISGIVKDAGKVRRLVEFVRNLQG
ncbi:MAG: methylenetetrahydrofolate reductase [Thermotogaceae bacterium]|nr:methylenetetrahydrofolate reductase [Thermotogaceae bacterium]